MGAGAAVMPSAARIVPPAARFDGFSAAFQALLGAVTAELRGQARDVHLTSTMEDSKATGNGPIRISFRGGQATGQAHRDRKNTRIK
jgi:hypothetical protein